MDARFSIVTTTTDSYEAARAMARALLSARLAACVQIAPICSHYVWKEEMREEEEYLLQIKARTQDYEAIASAIRAAHSYENSRNLESRHRRWRSILSRLGSDQHGAPRAFRFLSLPAGARPIRLRRSLHSILRANQATADR